MTQVTSPTAVGSARWVLLEAWGGRLLQLTTFVILGRLLDPAAFGLVALATTIAAIVALLVDVGFSEFLIADRAQRRETYATAVWSSFGLGLFLAMTLEVTAPAFSGLFGDHRLTNVLRVMAIALPIGALESIAVAKLQKAFSFRLVALRRLAAAAVAAVVGVSMAALGAGVWALVAQTLVYPTIGVAILYSHRTVRPGLTFQLRELQRMLRFGIQVLAGTLLGLSNRYVDKLLVGSVLGVRALGLYTVAFRLVTVLLDFSTTAISGLALPALARHQDAPAQMRSAFSRAARFSSGLGHPSFLVLAAAAPVLVPVLFGHQWEGTIGTMQVLCLLGVIQVATYLDRPLFLAVRRPDVDLWLTAAGSALDVVGIVIAVHWGVLAVASVLACRAVLFFPVRMFVRQRVTGVLAWPYLGSFMTTLTAAGAAAIGVVSINEFLARAPGPLLLIGDVAVATAAYSLILLKVNPCLANEIGRLVLQVARPTSSRPRLAATGPSLRPEGEGP